MCKLVLLKIPFTFNLHCDVPTPSFLGEFFNRILDCNLSNHMASYSQRPMSAKLTDRKTERETDTNFFRKNMLNFRVLDPLVRNISMKMNKPINNTTVSAMDRTDM